MKVDSIIKEVKADLGYYILLLFTLSMLVTSILTDGSDDERATPEVGILLKVH